MKNTQKQKLHTIITLGLFILFGFVATNNADALSFVEGTVFLDAQTEAECEVQGGAYTYWQGEVYCTVAPSVDAMVQSNIYFDESDSTWKDQDGVCEECTPENGYRDDGVYEHQDENGIYVEQDLSVSSTNEGDVQYGDESGVDSKSNVRVESRTAIQSSWFNNFVDWLTFWN